jgi:anti-sigma B factor antagonist
VPGRLARVEHLSEELGVEVRIRADGAVVVHLSGEVDASVAQRLEDVTHLGGSGLDLVVDLQAVSFLDSSGLRALVKAKRACDDRSRTFVVIAPSGIVRRVLQIAGLDDYLTIVD